MDFGTAPAGQPYLVMEYLEGIDLDHRIRQVGKLSLAAAVHITKQVASALNAAHDQGVVHRDLKPANIFLVELPGEPDFAKVLDFGISKVRAANTQLTKASSILGTPNYMAPEQATGMLDEIDARTDQWSLACIVWEMLSGRPPFAADDVSAVFYQVIHLEPQPLCKHAPELPPAVETVLRRGLSKTIGERFPSVRDFAEALAAAATGRLGGRNTSSSDSPATPAGAGAADDAAASAAGGDRRRRRVERRREPDDAPSLWMRVKPIHAVSCLALAVVVAVLVTLRWSHSATAAAPAAPTAVPLTKASVAPSVAPLTDPATVPAALPPSVPMVPPPAPAEPALREFKRATPPRIARSKPAVHEEPDPFENVRRPRHAGPARADGDRIAPHPSRSGHTEFVDPFAP
jgi:serine/threonine-protein kinase